MKKIVLTVSLLAILFLQKSIGQDASSQPQLSNLLSSYLNLKDALVAGDAGLAVTRAGQFIEISNSIDFKIISEGNIYTLVKDATLISESKDIKKQREFFASLSNNMISLASKVKLSNSPLYHDYCPMKKANWLSKDKAIKNPYYGNSMLTCGQVVKTLQ